MGRRRADARGAVVVPPLSASARGTAKPPTCVVLTREIAEASLSDYDPTSETWVLTRNNRPVAAVVPIPPGADAESFAMSHNAGFIEILNRSWLDYLEKGGTPLEEVRRRYGLGRAAPRRKRSALPR